MSVEFTLCDCYLDPVSLLFDDEALRVSEESLASLDSFTAVHLLIDWSTKVGETHCQDPRAASFGEILRDVAMKSAHVFLELWRAFRETCWWFSTGQ